MHLKFSINKSKLYKVLLIWSKCHRIVHFKQYAALVALHSSYFVVFYHHFLRAVNAHGIFTFFTNKVFRINLTQQFAHRSIPISVSVDNVLEPVFLRKVHKFRKDFDVTNKKGGKNLINY
jgi:hypothetical protein